MRDILRFNNNRDLDISMSSVCSTPRYQQQLMGRSGISDMNDSILMGTKQTLLSPPTPGESRRYTQNIDYYPKRSNPQLRDPMTPKMYKELSSSSGSSGSATN